MSRPFGSSADLSAKTEKPETVPPTLLGGLVDDAGLFPPEELPMAAALDRFRAQAEAGNPVVSGRFLCPASRLAECAGQLRDGERLPLGLICPLDAAGLAAALAAVAAEPRLELASVEGLPPDDMSGLRADVPLYVEVTPGTDLRPLAGRGLRAKVRCGGLRAELFPTPEALAGFVRASADLGVAFKATAGLHHAVAHRDPATGFDHHGFLNLVLAAARAAAGAGEAEIAEVLACRDAVALVEEARRTPDRGLLVCYGSCSTTEPLEDLVALGLVP